MAGLLLGALFALGALDPHFLLVFFPRANGGSCPLRKGPLTAMGYAGRAGCLLVCCFSGDIFTPHFGPLFWLSLALLAVYWLLWVRFFLGGRNFPPSVRAPLGRCPFPWRCCPCACLRSWLCGAAASAWRWWRWCWHWGMCPPAGALLRR